jgi:ADP-ribose pyrophosphatase YjhB (NUDIX family)
MVREATASTVLVRRDGSGWLVALAWHPRMGGWLPTGGHVEDGETPAQTARREALEETGMRVRLLSLPLPRGFPHRPVAAPWWIVEMPACADSHTGVEHIHVDHVFVGAVDADDAVGAAECRVRWFTEDEVASDPEVADDSRLQALQVLALLGQARQLATV